MTTVTRLLICSAMLVPSAATAQASGSPTEAQRPTVQAISATGAIQIDGRLNEAAWASAPLATEFTQVDPEEGRPVSERTEARIIYDSDALYIGVRLYDREPVSGRLGRRDMPL